MKVLELIKILQDLPPGEDIGLYDENYSAVDEIERIYYEKETLCITKYPKT